MRLPRTQQDSRWISKQGKKRLNSAKSVDFVKSVVVRASVIYLLFEEGAPIRRTNVVGIIYIAAIGKRDKHNRSVVMANV